jgi:phage RecT family recombinase
MSQQPQTKIALQHTQTVVHAILEKRKKQIAQVLSSEPRAERLILSGMIAVAEMRDSAQCDPVSIARSVMQAAMLGIDLTAGLGEGWLIKYGNQCTLSPGYRCWQRAAQSAGYDVVFDVVREGDEFEIKKIPPSIMHKQKLDKKGEIIGAYAAAYKQGTPAMQPSLLHSVEWCSKDELEQAHNASKSPNSPAWVNWGSRMNRKLPLVRIVKDLPVDWTGRNAKLIEVERISNQGGGYDIDFDDNDSIINGSITNEPQPEESRQTKTKELMEKRRNNKNNKDYDITTGEVFEEKDYPQQETKMSEGLKAALAGIEMSASWAQLNRMTGQINKLKGEEKAIASKAYSERKAVVDIEREPGFD